MAPENSLQQYKANLNSGNPSNNFNRPNLDYRNGGRLESTNYNTIKNSSPNIGWNNYSSSDPILNFGSTGSSIKGSGFVNALGTIATVATGVMGLGMSVFAVANAVKASKASSSGSNSSAPAADENLSSLTQTANNYDKKSDTLAMSNTNKNLMTAIETAKAKEANAKRDFATAETTLTNKNKDRAKFDQQRTDFMTQRDALKTSIDTQQGELDILNAKPADERTPEENALITKLENEIADAKKKLDTEYSDNKLKTIENQIERLDKDIAEWTNKKLEAQIMMKQLPSEIKTAENAQKTLQKKIDNQGK